MGHAQVAFDFMRVNIAAPSIAVAEENVNEQVNTSHAEGSGAAGRSIGQRGSDEGRPQRGRGWRIRGRNERRRSDGKERVT